MGVDPISLALIGTAIAGTITSTVGAMKANKAQKAQEDAKGRLEQIRAKRERTQQIREARVRKAEILQSGANAGASESSSVQSGASGVYAQAYGNISYINQQESTGTAIRNARQSELDAEGTQILGKGITDIAMVGLQAQSVFSSTTPKTPKKDPNIFDTDEPIG